MACRILVPQPRTEFVPLAAEAQSLNYLTTSGEHLRDTVIKFTLGTPNCKSKHGVQSSDNCHKNQMERDTPSEDARDGGSILYR